MSWTNENTLGLIPAILSPRDNRPVAEQIRTGYAHGGGYNPVKGFSLEPNRLRPGKAVLTYPGDPAYKEWGRCYFPHTEELALVFSCAFVAIVQADGSFEVTRMD